MPPVTCGTERRVPSEEILAHLSDVLTDRRFASADRISRFLRHVVERTLDGRAEEIKETVIATEVYGRSSDYDPKTDSIVRVEASRLRQKLRNYYEQEGQDARVRIHLPPGAYVPSFECRDTAPAREAETSLPAPAAAAFPRMVPIWVAAAAVVLIVLSVSIAVKASGKAERHPEAVAALAEARALLDQDPHAADTDRGTPATLLRAIEQLELAVAIDPQYALAWAKLAEAYDYAFPHVGRNADEDARRAEAAARRAVALDDKLSEAHHMLGLVLWGIRWDYPAAERSYRRALELDPGNVYAAIEYADLLRTTGRSGQAAEVIRKARALRPALAQLAAKEAEIQLDLDRVDAAIAAATQAIQINRGYRRAYVTLGMAEELKGSPDSALAKYEYVLAMDPRDRRALPAYGYLLGRTGKTERARQVARQLEKMHASVRNCAFQIAIVYAGLGDSERALDWLDQAWRSHQTLFPFARVERRFRHLDAQPGFRDLLRKADHAAGL